jgi:hypothetical protein
MIEKESPLLDKIILNFYLHAGSETNLSGYSLHSNLQEVNPTGYKQLFFCDFVHTVG